MLLSTLAGLAVVFVLCIFVWKHVVAQTCMYNNNEILHFSFSMWLGYMKPIVAICMAALYVGVELSDKEL